MAELIPDFEEDYLTHDDEEDDEKDIEQHEEHNNNKINHQINEINIKNDIINNNNDHIDNYINSSLNEMDDEERAILEALDNFKEEVMIYDNNEQENNIILPPVPIIPIIKDKNIEQNIDNIVPIVPIAIENNDEIINNDMIKPAFNTNYDINNNQEKIEIDTYQTRSSTDWTALYPQINENSSTGPLYPTLSQNTTYDTQIHTPQIVEKTDDDSEALIRQLMEENERLKNQLNNNVDTKEYQQSYHPGTLNNNSSSSNNNNNMIQQQQDITDEANYPIEESSASPAKDIRIDAEGIVYLQCGGCGQWLRVPGQSQLVRCPKCGIVNKCVIGSETEQSNDDNNNNNNNNAVTLPQQPFYLQCFNRWRT